MHKNSKNLKTVILFNSRLTVGRRDGE